MRPPGLKSSFADGAVFTASPSAPWRHHWVLPDRITIPLRRILSKPEWCISFRSCTPRYDPAALSLPLVARAARLHHAARAAALVCGADAVTLDRQHPTGAPAGRQLAGLLGDLPAGAGVLIVVRDIPQDRELAAALGERLVRAGLRVHSVYGDPPLARRTILEMAERGERIDAIACTDVTAAWALFDRVGRKVSRAGRSAQSCSRRATSGRTSSRPATS